MQIPGYVFLALWHCYKSRLHIHTYMHACMHTLTVRKISSTKHDIMYHCYTSKSDDPKGKLWNQASLDPDNCGKLGPLRKSGSWTKWFEKIEAQFIFSLRNSSTWWVENLKLHLQSTFAVNILDVYIVFY